MKIAMTMIALAVLGTAGGRADESRLRIYTDAEGIIPGFTFYPAKDRAAKMLATAGVPVEWRSGRPSPDQLRREGAISIHVISRSPETVSPGALAFALPFERTQITLMYDRLVTMAEPVLRPALLAHVMVHEIAHILEGVDSHADRGIMRAHWTKWDLACMMLKPLPFTDHDIEMMQDGFTGRFDRK